jgi:hypothetical protein
MGSPFFFFFLRNAYSLVNQKTTFGSKLLDDIQCKKLIKLY